MVITAFKMPEDRNGDSVQLLPADYPLSAKSLTGIWTTQTEIILNDATTFIRLYAFNFGCYLLYWTGTVSSANFHRFIPKEIPMDFFVPEWINKIQIIALWAVPTFIIEEN